MSKELMEALEAVEREHNISKDVLLDAIENSLITACRNNYGRADNIRVEMNRETGDFAVIAEKEVVETVEDSMLQISEAEARMREEWRRRTRKT